MYFQKTIYAILACVLLLSACESEFHPSNINTEASATADTSYVLQDSARVVIKSAEISLQVEQIPIAIKDIQQNVNAMKGHVVHYEMNNNKYTEKEVAFSLDSSHIIHRINPTGYMRVKVPVAYADTFITNMLSMHASIDKILLDEEDVTEDLNETKAYIESSTVKFPSKAKLDEQTYLDEKQQTNIYLKSKYARLKQRASFLWFDIRLSSYASIEKQVIASTKDTHEPFYVNTIQGLQNGWYSFSVFIVAVLHVWPFVLLAIIICVVYKRKYLRA